MQHPFLCVACFSAGNMTASNEFQKNKRSVFLSADFVAKLCSQAAFFSRDGNAIIYKNCIVTGSEKLSL